MVPNRITVQLSSFKILLAEFLQIFHLDFVESHAPCSRQVLDNLVQLFSRIGYESVVVVGHFDDFQLINYLTSATNPFILSKVSMNKSEIKVCFHFT